MIKLKRILFPTDFSQNSKFAISYACAFAEQFQAELHLLYVLQDMVVSMPAPDATLLMPGINQAEVKASAQAALEKSLDPAWVKGKQIVRATRSGSPFVEIVRYAKEQDIDLIVLGTHGHTGLMHVLMGSVAENVVRKAGCPVLTVRPSDHKFVMP